MKISVSLFYFLLVMVSSALDAMEKKSVLKALIQRSIPQLTVLCYKSLALSVLTDIKKDNEYDFEKFKNHLLELEICNQVPEKLCSFLAEELSTVPLNEIGSTIQKDRIDHVILLGNNVVWSRKDDGMPNAQGAFWDCYNVYSGLPDDDQKKRCSTLTNFYKKNVSDTKKCFAVSTQGCFAKIENDRLYIMKPEEFVIIIPLRDISILNDSSFSCVTFNPTSHSCFVGTSRGEIFIINFTDKFAYEKTKLTDIYENQIKTLYCTDDQQLYSCDSDGNNHVWLNNFRTEYQLPFKEPIDTIISSGDNSLIAFQHAKSDSDLDSDDVSILNWNALTCTTHTLGKVVALTQSRKILATKDKELIYYDSDGRILKKLVLNPDAIVYGNNMSSREPSMPSYLIITRADTKKTVDDYNYYAAAGGLPVCIKSGSHQETWVKSSFLIPQLTDEELFNELIKVRNDYEMDCD